MTAGGRLLRERRDVDTRDPVELLAFYEARIEVMDRELCRLRSIINTENWSAIMCEDGSMPRDRDEVMP